MLHEGERLPVAEIVQKGTGKPDSVDFIRF